MELSKQLDQKLKELRVLREEIVLAIRKAFAFEDLPYKDFRLTMHGSKGFGLMIDDRSSYILAYPDVIDRSIRVTVSLRCRPERVYRMDCKDDISDASEELRSLILGFFVEFELGRLDEEIRW